MPGYVKIIVIAQAATILSLTVWMYQVYLNDIYFQEYVMSLFRSNIIAGALLTMAATSVFALVTFTMLGSMSTTRRQSKVWRVVSEQAKAPHMPSLPVPETIERPSKPRSTNRQPRPRKPRGDTEKILHSMRYYDPRSQTGVEA